MKRAEHALLVTTLLAISLLACRIARCQEPDTALVLAQAALAEEGWTNTQGHAATLHALKRRADKAGVPVADMAHDFCAVFNSDTPRAQWIRALTLGDDEPAGWPRDEAKWSRHADKWQAIVAMARAFVADPASVPDPCPRSTNFGSATDPQPLGTVPVVCAAGNRHWRMK